MADLTYSESANLMNDMAFRGRIKVACMHYAQYILDEAPSTPAHFTRLRWAQSAYQQPDMIAQQHQTGVVMEPQVQVDGANITDPNLQTAVETVVNKSL